jgi:hypothetical protein
MIQIAILLLIFVAALVAGTVLFHVASIGMTSNIERDDR